MRDSHTQSLSYGPTSLEAVGNARVCESRLSCPFGNTLSAAIMSKVAHCASVCLLLLSSSPSAIGWGVVAIIVNAVQFQARRALTHIRKEVLKLAPTFAELNSATAISWVVAVLRVGASSTSGRPSSICRGLTHSMRTLFAAPPPRFFSVQTPATSGKPFSQQLSASDNNFPAVAFTLPHGGGASANAQVWCAFYANKSPKPLSVQVDNFRHDALAHKQGLV